MAISNYGMLIGGVSHYENFHRIPKLSPSSNTIFHQMKLKIKGRSDDSIPILEFHLFRKNRFGQLKLTGRFIYICHAEK